MMFGPFAVTWFQAVILTGSRKGLIVWDRHFPLRAGHFLPTRGADEWHRFEAEEWV